MTLEEKILELLPKLAWVQDAKDEVRATTTTLMLWLRADGRVQILDRDVGKIIYVFTAPAAKKLYAANAVDVIADLEKKVDAALSAEA